MKTLMLLMLLPALAWAEPIIPPPSLPKCTAEDWQAGRVFQPGICQSVFSEATPEEQAAIRTFLDQRQREIQAYQALPTCTPAQEAEEERHMMKQRFDVLSGKTLNPLPWRCKRKAASRQQSVFQLAATEPFFLPCTRAWLEKYVSQNAGLRVGAPGIPADECRIETPPPSLCDHPARVAMWFMMSRTPVVLAQGGEMQTLCRDTPTGPMMTEVLCEREACLRVPQKYQNCTERPARAGVRVFRCGQ